ncbi:hypothetical protein [Paraburkholderia sp.]|uniref:hypothetical protein n=1 Tax=Paraburkholderia sp. TaxID=1926495 RepID=UPI002F3EBF89
MISGHAKESIERIFFKAAKSRLTMSASDVCEIVPGAQAVPAANVVVLTISGMVFRLLLILQFDENDSTRDYFIKDAVEREFREVFLETCNLCCGAVNQELIEYFPDLGMSTPYVLDARCMSYVTALKPDLLASYAVTINGTVALGATICVCAHAPLDFDAEVSEAEDSGGELELF